MGMLTLRAARRAFFAFVAYLSFASVGKASEPIYVLSPSQLFSRPYSAADMAAKRKDLDEYAIRSKLEVLKEGDRDEIRFWVTWANFEVGTIGYDTEGYLISDRGSSVCRITYPPKQRLPFVGSCKPNMKSPDVRTLVRDLRDLATFSGQSISCGVVDGEWVEIDGVYAGQRFTIDAGNPDACHDAGSALVTKVLARVRSGRSAQPSAPPVP